MGSTISKIGDASNTFSSWRQKESVGRAFDFHRGENSVHRTPYVDGGYVIINPSNEAFSKLYSWGAFVTSMKPKSLALETVLSFSITTK